MELGGGRQAGPSATQIRVEAYELFGEPSSEGSPHCIGGTSPPDERFETDIAEALAHLTMDGQTHVPPPDLGYNALIVPSRTYARGPGYGSQAILSEPIQGGFK